MGGKAKVGVETRRLYFDLLGKLFWKGMLLLQIWFFAPRYDDSLTVPNLCCYVDEMMNVVASTILTVLCSFE